MPDRWFGPGDVVNRRVSQHIDRLVPDHLSGTADYSFRGTRVLPPDQIPGRAESGTCTVEAYVGERGQFQVSIARTLDPEQVGEWTCHNRISRKGSTGTLDPFEYEVRTVLDIGNRERTDRSKLTWETLGEDLIYGGREAQAAVLLTEKIANERGRTGGNYSSLATLGSLSGVVDNRRGLDVEWTDVDRLLGPDAETIAANASVDRLESDAKKKQAQQKGVEFLAEDPDAEFSNVDPEELQTLSQESTPESWETIPADMTAEKAEKTLEQLREQIDELRDDLDTE